MVQRGYKTEILTNGEITLSFSLADEISQLSHLYYEPIKFPSISLLLPLKFPFHVPSNFPFLLCCSYLSIHAESKSN